jgi:superfamily II DNA/RNA helicase
MSLAGSATDYLHRAGRTGRLQRAGKSITLFQEQELFLLQRYQNELQIQIKMRKLRMKQPPVAAVQQSTQQQASLKESSRE